MLNKTVSKSFACLLGIGLIGCTIQLAPAPSDKILEESQSSLIDGLTLLDSMKFGAPNGSYDSRKDNYSALIGKLESVATLIEVRLPPAGLESDAVQKIIESSNSNLPALELTEALEKADHKASLNALGEITYLQAIDKACSSTANAEEGIKPTIISWTNSKGEKVEVEPVPKNGMCPTAGHVAIAKKGFTVSMQAVTFYEQLLFDLKGEE
ncbi:TPA: hypothetical protein ACPVXW_000441 [Vibrio parahaemolyticus]